MAIPPFQEITRPLLTLASDGQVRTLAVARKELAKHFKLTEAEELELLPIGKQSRFGNRVSWAKIYLDRAGLLSSPGRGQFQITPRGREVLENPPEILDMKYLSRYPEFRTFRAKADETLVEPIRDTEPGTPEEILESAYRSIRAGLASDLLERVKSASPAFFERLVVDLLLKMGYGRAGRGEVVGKSGDEGIDGVIAEDRLGLEMVYLQAKRWAGTVGRPEIQKFVGALHGQRAKKGVFITTGTFSSDAIEYARSIDPRVAMIDGNQLAQFMIDYGVGVSLAQVYEMKKIDSDYFDE
jgi:restriction system protein